MAVVFPAGIHPFIFSGSLRADTDDTSPDSLDQHIAAFNVVDFNAAVPPGAATLFLTFVVFAYPEAANTPTAFPKVPIVEILQRGAGFDGRGVALQLTPGGTASLDLGTGQLINYSFQSLGSGVFQIAFTPNTVTLASIDWQVRFTVNDGVTGSSNQIGLTFSVDTADTRFSWIAVPGQLDLTGGSPGPIVFEDAVAGLTLAHTTSPTARPPLMGGKVYQARLPVGNYGTGPLKLTSIDPLVPFIGVPAGLADPLPVIAPGSTQRGAVETSFSAPPGTGGTGEFLGLSSAWFTIASNDPLAAREGTTAHINSLNLNTSCVPADWLAVPNLLGMNSATGEAAIRAAGFIARTLGKSDAAGTGLCVKQNPAAGSFNAPHSRVRMWVSASILFDGQVLTDDELGTGPSLPGDKP